MRCEKEEGATISQRNNYWSAFRAQKSTSFTGSFHGSSILNFTEPSPQPPPAEISNKLPKQGCYPNPAKNPSLFIASDNPHPDAKLRINAYRELAEANPSKSIPPSFLIRGLRVIRCVRPSLAFLVI
jgi:hypothetical protein